MLCRTMVILGMSTVALIGGGCSTVQNLGSVPFGDCHQEPGLVYGGIRSDVASLVSYPSGSPLFFISIPIMLTFDVVGDTVTLPYILACQWYNWAKARQPNTSSSLPSRSDNSLTQPTETFR